MNGWSQQPCSYLTSLRSPAGIPSQQPMSSQSQRIEQYSRLHTNPQRPILRQTEFMKTSKGCMNFLPSRHIHVDPSDLDDEINISGEHGFSFMSTPSNPRAASIDSTKPAGSMQLLPSKEDLTETYQPPTSTSRTNFLVGPNECSETSSSIYTGAGNISESVKVGSSFDVAEIVGKQGVKIKKIRASTNTWIKTPPRGNDPIFVITGRKEGVDKAKAEILAAAERVSKIRYLRSHGKSTLESFTDSDENSIQVQVHVPTNSVGLLIGPKGARIKEIAEISRTYIKTPSKHKAPIFELFGAPGNVAEAKALILGCVTEFANANQLKNYMKQLPIHEPGSPIKLPDVLSFPSAAAVGQNAHFTKLRLSGAPRMMPHDTNNAFNHAAYLPSNLALISDDLHELNLNAQSICTSDKAH